MIRTGLAGLLALIALTAGLLRALWRTPSRDAGLLGPGVLPALLAMQLVWFLTWVPGSEQGIVTGLAIAVAAAQASRRNLHARPMSSPTVGPRADADRERPAVNAGMSPERDRRERAEIRSRGPSVARSVGDLTGSAMRANDQSSTFEVHRVRANQLASPSNVQVTPSLRAGACQCPRMISWW